MVRYGTFAMFYVYFLLFHRACIVRQRDNKHIAKRCWKLEGDNGQLNPLFSKLYVSFRHVMVTLQESLK